MVPHRLLIFEFFVGPPFLFGPPIIRMLHLECLMQVPLILTLEVRIM